MAKDRAAVSLGRRGGHARASNMSREQLSQSASYAANSRWISNRRQMLQALHEFETGRIGLTRKFQRQKPLKREKGQFYGYREGDELLSLDELAARLKITKTTAYGLTRKRAHVRSVNPLPCFKVGKELRFNWSAVVEWLDQLEKGGTV